MHQNAGKFTSWDTAASTKYLLQVLNEVEFLKFLLNETLPSQCSNAGHAWHAPRNRKFTIVKPLHVTYNGTPGVHVNFPAREEASLQETSKNNDNLKKVECDK